MAAIATASSQPVRARKDRERLEKQARALYLRLEDGYARIERGLSEGQDVTRWEDLWKRLLRDYEQVCDLLDVAED
jgi:hypothetical protein